jgi:hypothetical protein
LVIACLAATISPDVLPLSVALFLLGLGWNFCFVGGSTCLPINSLRWNARAHRVSTTCSWGWLLRFGSLQSGFIFASLGYNMMAYLSAAFALIPLLVVAVWMSRTITARPATGD